jgi:hypothetical protein
MAKEEFTKTVTMSLIVLATTTGVAVLQAGSATAEPGTCSGDCSGVGTGATNSADVSPGPIGVPPGINKLFLKFSSSDNKFTNLTPVLKISALFHKFSADGSVTPPPIGGRG